MTTEDAKRIKARIEWWRTDLNYKAPEQWPDRLESCFDDLKELVDEILTSEVH